MAQKENLKMAIIAGASHALDYKERNPRADEQEILQHVTDNIEKIIHNIEEQEE